jgi:hypothetical protein
LKKQIKTKEQKIKTIEINYSEFKKAFINGNPIGKIKSIIKNNKKLAKDN